MSSKVRGAFLMIGSIIAFIGFVIPGLYGVTYNPPAHSEASKIVLNTLPHFTGGVSGSNFGVYNGFGGPIDLHITWISIIVTFLLGFFAEVVDIDKTVQWLKKNHPLLAVFSQITAIGSIIWKFRFNQTPSEIPQAFIADLKGSTLAVSASHYLSSTLGLGFLILLFGFVVGSVGAYSGRGCALLTIFILAFFGLLLYTRITTGVW